MKTTTPVIVLLFITLTACVKVIEEDFFDIEPKIVINSYFCQGEPIKVFISKSFSPFFDTRPELIKQADVKLFEDNSFVGYLDFQIFYYDHKNIELIYNNDTIYSYSHFPLDSCFANTEIVPAAGHKYRIEVKVDGFDEVSAESFIPEIVPIDNLNKKLKHFTDNHSYSEKGIPYYEIIFNDPQKTNNYLFSLYGFQKHAMVKRNYQLPVPFSSDDPVVGYYENDLNNDAPILMLFSDQLFNGSKYSLVMEINEYILFQNSQISHLDSIEITFALNNLSVEMNQYLLSLQESRNQNDNPLSEPVSVFTNIENGLGVFVGYSRSEYSLYILNKDK